MLLPLELEKLIISYTDPKIYRYMITLDSKNYTNKKFRQFLYEYSLMISKELEIEYNYEKQKLFSSLDLNDHEYSRKKLREYEATVIFKILDYYQNWELLSYKKEILNSKEISYYSDDVNLLKFFIKFEVDPKLLDFEINPSSSCYNFSNEYYILKGDYNRDKYCGNLLLCLNNKTSNDIILKIYQYQGLWKLLSKILEDQARELF
jgi:hypothetical protein